MAALTSQTADVFPAQSRLLTQINFYAYDYLIQIYCSFCAVFTHASINFFVFLQGVDICPSF